MAAPRDESSWEAQKQKRKESPPNESGSDKQFIYVAQSRKLINERRAPKKKWSSAERLNKFAIRARLVRFNELLLRSDRRI